MYSLPAEGALFLFKFYFTVMVLTLLHFAFYLCLVRYLSQIKCMHLPLFNRSFKLCWHSRFRHGEDTYTKVLFAAISSC